MNATIRVPVNLRNPGEFLACCGLLEIATRTAEHNVAPSGRFARSLFEIHDGSVGVLDAVRKLTDTELTPADADENGAPLAARTLSALCLRLDWWGEPGRGKERWAKTAFKLWAGQQTSTTIYSTLRTTVAQSLATDGVRADAPFALRSPLTSRFGFDPGAAWNALDAGFSPNDQGYDVQSSPVVELLAAIGIQRFRPIPVPSDRDAFEYVAWSQPLPACVAASAASGCVPDSAARRFRFRIASRGSYGCFTTANEIAR